MDKKSFIPILFIIFSLLSINVHSVSSDDLEPTSFVRTYPATSVEEQSARLRGEMFLDASSIGFEYGTNTSYGNSASTSRDENIFAGGHYRDVYKYTMSLTKVDEDEDIYYEVRALDSDEKYLYVTGGQGAGGAWIDQYWKYNLTRKQSASNNSIGRCIAVDDNFVYAGVGRNVNKYYKSNMSFVDTIESIDLIYSLVVDDTYLYCTGTYVKEVGGNPTAFAGVWKINKFTMERIDDCSLGSVEDIAQDEDYLYCSLAQKVYKIDKGSMSLVDESSSYGADILAVAVDDNFVYAGGTQPTCKIYQYYKSTMNKKSETAKYGTGTYDNIYDITFDDNYIYVGGSTSKIKKYRISDLAKTDETDFGGIVDVVHYTVSDTFQRTISGLSPGTIYHFRAYADNFDGDDETFLTKPLEPSGFTAETYGGHRINLSWNKGDGAEYTIVRRKEGSFPISRTDGVSVYSGTNNYYNDTFLNSTTEYFYRGWSYTSEDSFNQYSDLNASINITTGTSINTAPNQPTSYSPSSGGFGSVYGPLSVTVTDNQLDKMNVSIYWVNHTLIGSFNNVPCFDTVSISFVDEWLDDNSYYEWYVNISDGEFNTTTPVYNFSTSKEWDTNGDGIINYMDVSTIVGNYNQNCLPGQYGWDVNDDGTCNYLDVSVIVAHYGESY